VVSVVVGGPQVSAEGSAVTRSRRDAGAIMMLSSELVEGYLEWLSQQLSRLATVSRLFEK